MPNVINLKKAREAQRKKQQPPRHRRNQFLAGKSPRDRIAAVFQVVLFFALFAWFMQTCAM